MTCRLGIPDLQMSIPPPAGPISISSWTDRVSSCESTRRTQSTCKLPKSDGDLHAKGPNTKGGIEGEQLEMSVQQQQVMFEAFASS